VLIFWNAWGVLNSWNPQDVSRPVLGLLCHLIYGGMQDARRAGLRRYISRLILDHFHFEEAAHKHMCLQKATIRRAGPLARKVSYCRLVLAYVLTGAHPEFFHSEWGGGGGGGGSGLDLYGS